LAPHPSSEMIVRDATSFPFLSSLGGVAPKDYPDRRGAMESQCISSIWLVYLGHRRGRCCGRGIGREIGREIITVVTAVTIDLTFGAGVRLRLGIVGQNWEARRARKRIRMSRWFAIFFVHFQRSGLTDTPIDSPGVPSTAAPGGRLSPGWSACPPLGPLSSSSIISSSKRLA
jgi:hypothetical protein